MADVAASDDAEITTDCSRLGVKGVSLAEESAASSNNTSSLPDHAHNGSRVHVPDQGGEEGTILEVTVMLFEEFFGWLFELEGAEEVPLGLKAVDDDSYKSSLDTVRLDHDVGALSHRC